MVVLANGVLCTPTVVSKAKSSIPMSTSYQTYLVGGAVRDELLGLEVIDKDWVVTGATPNKLLEAGFQQVGKQFPVFLHPQTKEEYALARTERKSGQGYTGFICDFSPSISLEEDLLRRDLTINAIAKSDNGELIDPFNGQADLENRTLRHVSDAFSEDPLRVLRVARFASRFAEFGFTIAPETMKLMTEVSQSGELETLSKERVWRELEKSLGYNHPDVFFEVLAQCSALPHLLAGFDWASIKALINENKSGVNTFTTIESKTLRWAYFCHKTPMETLAKLQDHLACPNQFKLYATLTNEFVSTHTLPLTAQSWLNWLTKFGAIKKPQIYQEFSLLLSFLTHTNNKDWFELRDCVAGVTAKEFSNQGLKGIELGQAINHARIEKLSELSNALVTN